MERSLRIIASLALLCGTLPARAAGPAPDATPTAGDALCEPGAFLLDEAQRAYCQELWRQRIEAARERSRSLVRQAIEESRLRREHAASLPPPPRAPVTVETFLNGDLAYGDVVVTDKGPRVFVGEAGEPPRPEDFVALDSARSPHRGRVGSYDGAYPQPRRPPGVKPRPATSSQQERRP
ncbi:hypothetical protein [Bosea sp. (in: a-proteobacteria)]|uniref:hypothetical protein n=1 Tax=Bosea sp. (in: a-proteobacteria) TaxID=1871050 RepID=UPI0026285C60|nr:hypothetical protein [Bosea sp. (in: a-proteobacteria)]MCO5091801.1 hypothetical protein [Bosea sp. (in: a-proteobacteria)]